jgi:PAS domain S-box-containing protein
MIITLYAEALQFLLQDGKRLFSNAPILALYLPLGFEPQQTDHRIIRHMPNPDIKGTLKIALNLVPGAKRVYVVSGANPMDKSVENRAREDFKEWEGRLEFHYLSLLPLDEILTRVATISSESIVFLFGFAADVTGKNFTTREVGKRLGETSKAPVFGLYDVVLGYGIAGGSLISFEYVGSQAGELTLGILRGTKRLEDMPTDLAVPHLAMFDWRQLRRWNLSESVLPRGSIVINKETTLWDFRYYLLGGLVFLIGQSFLTAGLLIDRRRRRSAEESLARAEEKYRSIFDSALEGIYETSPQGQFLTANRALAKMLGYDSPEELTSLIRDVANQVWAEPNGRANYLRLLDEKKVIRGFETQFLRKGGTKFWVSLNTRRVTGPDGETLLYSGFLEDITGRKQAEEALEERLAFEKLLAEISALFVNLPAERIDSEIEAAQRRICELLDLDRSSLWQTFEGEPGALLLTHIYQTPGSTAAPKRTNAREWFPWTTEKVLAGETIILMKMSDLPPEAVRDRESHRLFKTKSNVLIPLSVGGSPPFGLLTFTSMREERLWPETDVKGFQLVAEVFASALERKRAEEALRKKTEELDQFFNLSLELLCIANTDGYFLRLNPTWERVLGYAREELMASQFLDFVHPDDLDRTHKAVSTLASQQKVVYFENRYRCKDGTYRWLEWNAAPTGNLIYATARDITERLKEEVEARQRREDLAHVTRVAMMGELTTSLAHEINQPLTAILSNAEAAQRFLSQASPDIGEVRQILEDIVRDDRRANDVVRKVRALVKKEKFHDEPLDLNEVILAVVNLVQADSLLQGLSIATDLSPRLATIHGDGIQLQQVILNLILNGAAAMRNSPSGQRKIIVRTAMLDSRTVKAFVTDFGTGIDERHVDRLFEPFYTTKSEGLGMGLSISQTIIKAHGGSIEAWNNREGGATFAFTLPAHEGVP